MKRISQIIMSLILISTASCNQDFLDTEPKGTFTDSNVWSDLSLLELYVNDIYRAVPDGFNRGWYMMASCTDDGENTYSWSAGHSFNRGDYDGGNYPFDNWSKHYAVLRKINDFLTRAEEGQIEGIDTDKAQRMLGEIFFLRGFFYHELAKHYGGVPLVLEPLPLDQNAIVIRATYDETVAQIASDLDAAASLLPESYSGQNVGRATKGAALALKGRMLLYAEDWTGSAAASQATMDLSYALFGDYEGIFHTVNENNSEVIFDVQYNDPDRSHWAQLFNGIDGYPSDGWGGTSPTQELVDTYEMVDGDLIGDSPLYSASDPYSNRDPRFYASILYNEATWGPRNVVTQINGANGVGATGDATKTGYYMRKFMEEDFLDDIYANGASNNWILIRYAEVLLNYAEAQNEAVGPDASVYSAIDEVRNRVSMPPLPAGLNQAEMRDRIRRERRVELAFEEHRFFDVRRWGIAETVLNQPIHGMLIGTSGEFSGTGPNGETLGEFEVEPRFFSPKHYWAPIPISEIERSGIEQNPGW